MQIKEAQLRKIIRQEIRAIQEVSSDPYERARERFQSAVDRKGVEGALRDTMLRVDKLKSGSLKADGIVKWMREYRRSNPKLSAQEKKIIATIIRNAKAKASGET